MLTPRSFLPCPFIDGHFLGITDYADSKPLKLAPHGWGPALNVLPTRYVTTPWYLPLGLLTTTL